MIKIFRIIPYSWIGFHINIVCISGIIYFSALFLRMGIHLYNKEWWPVQAPDDVVIFGLPFVAIPILLCAYTIKRKSWAYIGSLIFSGFFFLFGILFINFIGFIGAIAISFYPLFIFVQESCGQYFYSVKKMEV